MADEKDLPVVVEEAPPTMVHSAAPAVIADAGAQATKRFYEFFTANIRNRNTREAYHRALVDFFAWCGDRGFQLIDVKPIIVAAYVECLATIYSPPTVKQHLAAIWMCFDWLVVGQILPMNPASAGRGPTHVVKRGKISVLYAQEARQLLDSIDDWSFCQLCKLARVSKDTLNRLSPKTASRALEETLPSPTGGKPFQTLTTGNVVRSIHGTAYPRLWNDDLLEAVAESAPDFTAPQKAAGGGTGLYCDEQDLFCFLIDPNGGAEIDGEAFAPGFFVWNSEVGRRSLGIQTFWFQGVCANHIVWDATEVVEFTRRHTANVRDGLVEIRRIIDRLVTLRDQRRDSFVSVMRRAATERLGDSAEDVMKVLTREGVGKSVAKQALEIAEQQGGFTIFALVDALTRISQKVTRYAGERTELDAKAAGFLALAA